MADKVIWVEDDSFALHIGTREFSNLGLRVHPVKSARELDAVLTTHADAGVIVLDIMLQPAKGMSKRETKAGFETGLLLGERVRTSYPGIVIIVYTAYPTDEIQRWGEHHRVRVYGKADVSFAELAREVRLILDGVDGKLPRPFIVHGHDEIMTLQLKNYLQNELGFPAPTILREQASSGRTVIEKFEEEAARAGLVFVLLTPDDVVEGSGADREKVRRARQNVIFEMGYFMGRLERRKGKVFLLHKQPCDLPSDLSGVVYIDVTHGVEAAGEQIRRELSPLVGVGKRLG